MATKIMRCIQVAPVKKGPEGGSDIGSIGMGTVLVFEVSSESPHDGWGHIVGPNPPINVNGTYLKTGFQGWAEMTHFREMSEEKTVIQIDINWTAKTYSFREV
jgi:hypothetical protein